jgi:hypothetical protein
MADGPAGPEGDAAANAELWARVNAEYAEAIATLKTWRILSSPTIAGR